MNVLKQQAKSRDRLAKAVKDYVGLRGADGDYVTTIRTTNRDGRPVVVFVRLDIISEEVADGRS